MSNESTHVNEKLRLDVSESENEIRVNWSGQASGGGATAFLTPILSELLEKSKDGSKCIVFDFSKLEFMNSSAITPLIKILERAKRGKNRIKIFFNSHLKWQELSFSALEIFKTEDDRITIKGT